MKPWKKKGWVIPPSQNGDFVANMENVLDVYKRPYDETHPVICMDESPKTFTISFNECLRFLLSNNFSNFAHWLSVKSVGYICILL